MENTAEIPDSRESTQSYGEKKIKRLAIGLALVEILASRVCALAVVWGTASVLSAFGYVLSFDDFWIVSLIIFAEAYRIFNRDHELKLQAIVTSKKDKMSTSMMSTSMMSTRMMSTSDRQRPTPSLRREDFRSGFGDNISRRFNPGNKTYGQLALTKGDFSLIPVPCGGYLFKPHALSRILYIVQLSLGIACIALPIWRLSHQKMCLDKGDYTYSSCVFSIRLFYIVTMCGEALFLVEKVVFEFNMRCMKLLSSVSKQLSATSTVDVLVLEKFYYSVYDTCINGSIFEGFRIDLIMFGIRWLESNDIEQQLHGAQLLNVLLSGKHGDSQNADALRRLGTYPGLMARLVEMLSGNSEDEGNLVDEITAIICNLVTSDHNCVRFAVVPGALKAVESLLMRLHMREKSRARTYARNHQAERGTVHEVVLGALKVDESPLMRRGDNFRVGESSAPTHAGNHQAGKGRVQETRLQLLYNLAATKNPSGRALRRYIGSMAGVLNKLKDVLEDGERHLQRLSWKIVYHLALEKDARDSICKTEGIRQSLSNLPKSNDNEEDITPEMVLQRLWPQN